MVETVVAAVGEEEVVEAAAGWGGEAEEVAMRACCNGNALCTHIRGLVAVLLARAEILSPKVKMNGHYSLMKMKFIFMVKADHSTDVTKKVMVCV